MVIYKYKFQTSASHDSFYPPKSLSSLVYRITDIVYKSWPLVGRTIHCAVRFTAIPRTTATFNVLIIPPATIYYNVPSISPAHGSCQRLQVKDNSCQMSLVYTSSLDLVTVWPQTVVGLALAKVTHCPKDHDEDCTAPRMVLLTVVFQPLPRVSLPAAQTSTSMLGGYRQQISQSVSKTNGPPGGGGEA